MPVKTLPARVACMVAQRFQASPNQGGWGSNVVPGSVNAQERHGLEAGLLRKVSDEVQQVLSVGELAQIDTVSHIQTVGHDAHLENTHTHTHTFLHKRYPTLTVFPPLSL